MDDIIVLILTLIFIVAGIFGQMKKRQLTPQTEEEPVERRNNFWEHLEDEEEQPVGVTEHLKPVNEGGRIDRFHTESQMMKRDIIPRTIEPLVKRVESKTSTRKKFELKKAVIYSAILNRKYF